MDPILNHPVNAHVRAPLPSGYATWDEYYQKTRDWSKGPAATVLNPQRVNVPTSQKAK